MAYQPFAKDIEKRRLGTLGIRERCRALKLLEKEFRDKPRVKKDGFDYPVLDEAQHQPRMAQWKSLLESLEFSPALHALLHKRTIAFAAAIAKNNPSENLHAVWAQANGARADDLRNFIARQSEIFSGPDSIPFTPGALELKPLKWQVRGSFNVASADPAKKEDDTVNLKRIADRVVPPIVLNDTILQHESRVGVYQTAFHEQMHSFLWQLGLAAHHKTIPESHPLYNDAVIMCERIKMGVEYSPHDIPGVYDADPVEKACLRYEALFAGQYAAASAPGLSGSVHRLLNRFFSP